MPTYYAHSAEKRPQSDWQTLKSHAENVAALAAQFADPFGAADIARYTGLLHDLGKAGSPGKPQYLKNEEAGARFPYRWNRELIYLSVPVRSLALILPHFPLTEEEIQAIVYHDGQYVPENHAVAAREEKLTLLLQYADNWSGFVTEKA
mgnify:CR=1 FL=1